MTQPGYDEALVQPDRVHRRIYVDQDIFDAEMVNIFERTWVFVGHESEIAEPGDFKTTRIGRHPVIMVRDRHGQIRLLFNRCTHRGAIVCREDKGNSKGFTCLYHGWTFSTAGELVGVPYADGYGEDFDTGALGLVGVPQVETYRGFVFACLDKGAASLDSYLGLAKHHLDLIVDRSPTGKLSVTRGVQKYAFRANWKLQLENFVDSYHPGFTHKATFERRRQRLGQTSMLLGDKSSENVYLGQGHSLIDYAAAEGGPRPIDVNLEPGYVEALQARHSPEYFDEVLNRSNMNLAIFPNLLFQSSRQHFRVVRPVRVDYTEIYVYPYLLDGAPEAQNDREVRLVGLWAGPAGNGQPDDVEAFERVNEGLQASQVEWVLFNRGVHREYQGKRGEIRGPGADEVAQRGQHRYYNQLMTAR
jgi:phenylpropionate dioxygenase-like ring-hydroxylating dioxygenase large terminal subunit